MPQFLTLLPTWQLFSSFTSTIPFKPGPCYPSTDCPGFFVCPNSQTKQLFIDFTHEPSNPWFHWQRLNLLRSSVVSREIVVIWHAKHCCVQIPDVGSSFIFCFSNYLNSNQFKSSWPLSDIFKLKQVTRLRNRHWQHSSQRHGCWGSSVTVTRTRQTARPVWAIGRWHWENGRWSWENAMGSDLGGEAFVRTTYYCNICNIM